MTVQASNLESEQLPDPSGAPEGDVSKLAGKSPTRLAIGRFRRDKLSMIAFVVVALYILAAISAPFLVKMGVLDPTTFHQELTDPASGGLPTGKLGGISWDHPLGVEPQTGRDVLSRVWYGLTFSLAIALSATLISICVGAVLGIIAGFTGGWVDSFIGRAIDLTLSFPATLMLLALSSIGIQLMADILPGTFSDPLPNGAYVVFVLALFGWPGVARIIRGQVLSVREREFVDAAVLLGASRRRLYFKEILPNLWAPLLVVFTLTMPAYISAEAALSYLNVGIKPPTPTLGNVLRSSINYSSADFVFFFTPAFLIMIIVVSFNLLGDGLRDALDPKTNR
ncbi:ABC transporter permease subunit [Nocardioides sp. LMS-CY]|uniref:Peptide/nickel transport system permease protein n=1 Tax=Nocardioides soli TaxID=1036020 RepID=A0A7W4VZV7_9ACTN|nr:MULTISPECIES: ABC transporter permease [Nocardioides]MBB3044369.1 peptide/nickel transport system permease protein [Nocardioides soli]QWF20325.1 ABC transporter permease subunit [Nocardioides sp. LMS-CY]